MILSGSKFKWSDVSLKVYPYNFFLLFITLFARRMISSLHHCKLIYKGGFYSKENTSMSMIPSLRLLLPSNIFASNHLLSLLTILLPSCLLGTQWSSNKAGMREGGAIVPSLFWFSEGCKFLTRMSFKFWFLLLPSNKKIALTSNCHTRLGYL